MPGTTENTGDSTSSVGSTSASTPSTASSASSSSPMTAVQALEKASGALSSSAASGQQSPDQKVAANGAGTPEATPAATAQAQTPATPEATGAIPKDRHETAVKNARTSGQVDALRAITGEQNITAQHQADVKTGYTLIGELRSNPKAFIENIARDLGLQIVDPRSTQQTPQGVKPGGMPAADLVSEDGKKAYSAEAMLQILDMKVKEAVEQVQGTIKPILADRETQHLQAQAAEAQNNAHKRASGFLTTMRTREHFTKENEPAILAKLQAMDPEMRKELGPFASLQTAYLDFIREVIAPKQAAEAEGKVREGFIRKANTAGSVAPNGGQPTENRKRPGNQRELSSHLARSFGE